MRTLLIAVLMLGLAIPATMAQPLMGRGREMKEKLNLTDQQAETLKDIRLTTAKQMVDLSSSIKKKSIDLRALMSESKPDRAAVKALMTDIGNLKIERNMLLFDTRTATMKVLTPEQQKQMKEIRMQQGQKMKKKFQNRRQGRRPNDRGDLIDLEPPGPSMGFGGEELPPPPTE